MSKTAVQKRPITVPVYGGCDVFFLGGGAWAPRPKPSYVPVYHSLCSMEDYTQANRAQFNVLIGKSEAEVTNNKRLRSRYCMPTVGARY